MKFGSYGNGLLVSHLSVFKYHTIMNIIIVIMKLIISRLLGYNNEYNIMKLGIRNYYSIYLMCYI